MVGIVLYLLAHVGEIGLYLYEMHAGDKPRVREPSLHSRTRHHRHTVGGHHPLQGRSRVIALEREYELIVEMVGELHHRSEPAGTVLARCVPKVEERVAGPHLEETYAVRLAVYLPGRKALASFLQKEPDPQAL